MRRLGPTLLAMALALLPATAPAQSLEPGAPALATQRYLIGRQLYREGKIEAAAAEFRTALQAFPTSAKLAYNLARTLERLGRLVPAAEHYREYLRLSPSAEDRSSVEGVIAALERRIFEAQPELVLSSTPAGARVRLDENEIPLIEATPGRAKVTAGAHVLLFQLAGHRDLSRTVELEAGQSVALSVTLEPVPSAPARPAHAATETVTDASGPRWLPLGLLGAGALSVAVGGVLFVQAQGTADAAARLDPTASDRAEHTRLLGDYDTERLVGWVGIGAGAVLAGTGVLLLLQEPSSDATAWTPTPGGLLVHGRF